LKIVDNSGSPASSPFAGMDLDGITVLNSHVDAATALWLPPVLPQDLTVTISPNPFNASTVASYKLRAASHVSLKVYDTAGRLVATLAEGWRDAGEHQVTFDGSKLASGVYLYRLTSSGSGTTPTTVTGKMVLLK
jgi:hypothetical protein